MTTQAIYVRLEPAPTTAVSETQTHDSGPVKVLVDFDAAGKPLGVEIIHPSPAAPANAR